MVGWCGTVVFYLTLLDFASRERERRGCGEAIQSGGQDLPVGMEFLMQPIKRFMVPEEVNDCEIPMEPLHYPVAARSRINPHSMGRFVR